ncbi:hypothetical protein QAD02_006334 [Eretmocerus hayati]|uniref:Uncharacterized protein n=1 Tax=Eretmocerus hayati TaxID=131215 RepID=A0ACC2N0Y8_9HYME|nr:hypothetical protein QAD02_006334 [Eretmocerus hayati]
MDERDRSAKDLSYFLENSYLLETWVKSLVDEDFSNLEDQYGLSFFHILCHGRDYDKSNKLLDAVKFFLRNNVNINHSVSLDDPGYPGYTALHFAMRNVRSDITKLILKHGADPTRINIKGLTPLHVLLKNQLHGSATEIQNRKKERIEIVKSLINGGADVDVKDLDGDTPLHHVFSDIFFETENDEPVAQLLISESKLDTDYVSSRGVSYLHIASSTNLAAVKTLLETKNASLERCIPSKGKFKSGQYPLHLAVSFGKVDIVEYLLGHKVDPNMCTYNSEKMTPLHLLCKYTQNECYGIEGRSRESLQSTMQSHGDSKVCIIELLLKNDASINKKDGFGSTPLLVACAIPVNTDIYSRERVSYVFEEIYDVQQKIIKTLLHNGADLHSFDNNRDSALHIIASQRVQGRPGIDLNIQTVSGNTPLYIAGTRLASNLSSNNSYGFGGPLPFKKKCFCIEELLIAGANVNILNVDGLTPLHKVFQWLMMDSSRSHPCHLDYFTYFMTHMKKLKKMNVFIGEKVRESLTQLSKVDLEKSLAIEISIDEESEKLKSKMVDQYTSYYDILLKDANGMSKHVKNEEFEKIINSPDLCIDYPVFHDILKRKFEVGLARSLLLDPAQKALRKLTAASLFKVWTMPTSFKGRAMC